MHGDNWRDGPLAKICQNVIDTLQAWGAELVEVPYTRNEQVRCINQMAKEKLAIPEFRRTCFRQLLKIRPIVKAIEVTNSLIALLAEKTVVEHAGKVYQFDAM